jgi:hypothetical protein
MKNLITHMLTPLFVAVLLLTGLTRAQSAPWIIQVNVPFDFTVGQKAFPAGEYSIVRVGPGRLDLRDIHRHVLGSLITYSVRSLEKSTTTKLEFSTAGGGHALMQVWLEGELIGDELAVPKRPTAVAKNNSRKPDEVRGGGIRETSGPHRIDQ